MSVIDAAAVFECARNGHEPSVTVDTNAKFVTSYVCRCLHCGRDVEFGIASKPGSVPEATGATPEKAR